MKKAKLREPKLTSIPGWIEIESQGAETKLGTYESLEVRIGSCVICVPPKFDKVSFTEVCKVLLSL
jgi:hypothetical protein